MWIRNLEFTSDIGSTKNLLNYEYSNIAYIDSQALRYLLEGEHVRYLVWEEYDFSSGRYRLFDYSNEEYEETINDISANGKINLVRHRNGEEVPSFSDEFWALRWDADNLLEIDSPSILRDIVLKSCLEYSLLIGDDYSFAKDMLLLKRPELESTVREIIAKIFDGETACRVFDEPLSCWSPYDMYLNLIFRVLLTTGKKVWALDPRFSFFENILDKIISEFRNTQFFIERSSLNSPLTEF